MVAQADKGWVMQRMMTEEPENYQRMLQSLVFRAQQVRDFAFLVHQLF